MIMDSQFKEQFKIQGSYVQLIYLLNSSLGTIMHLILTDKPLTTHARLVNEQIVLILKIIN